MTVIVHNIRSAYNVGSLFRTADAFGCTRLILCGITPGPLDRFQRENIRVTKVSLGAEKNVPWTRAQSFEDAVNQCRADDISVYALEQDPRAVLLANFNTISRPWRSLALAVGPEVDGFSQEDLRLTDQIIEIPVFGAKESLNVSVAFGIAAYHIKMHCH